MQQVWMIYPIFLMVLLSVGVGFRMLQLRFRAVLQDGLPAAYFHHNRGAEAPAYMLQAEQHYMNLYETPVLFYCAVILYYVTGVAGVFSLVLAWSYVVTRLVHTYIHLGSNRLRSRRNIFMASILCLVLLWVDLFVRLITHY